MGIIREPNGVEFTVLPVKLSAKDRREISECIADHRRQQDVSQVVRVAKEILRGYEQRQKSNSREAKARTAREKLEAKALALPSAERTHLAYQLLSSLASEETDKSQREWASAAKVEFEQLHSSRPPTKASKKPARRAKSARA